MSSAGGRRVGAGETALTHRLAGAVVGDDHDVGAGRQRLSSLGCRGPRGGWISTLRSAASAVVDASVTMRTTDGSALSIITAEPLPDWTPPSLETKKENADRV